MNDDPISAFLAAIETATVDEADVFTDDAVLDATVPNWRMRVEGSDAIRAEYAKWFDHPASFIALERIPTPDGEVVLYEHEWLDGGIRHRGHHAHVIVVVDGKIASDTVWCGGKWSESLLQSMALAAEPDEAMSRDHS